MQFKEMQLANCEKNPPVPSASLRYQRMFAWVGSTHFVSLSRTVCSINWFTASFDSVSPSGICPELYFLRVS